MTSPTTAGSGDPPRDAGSPERSASPAGRPVPSDIAGVSVDEPGGSAGVSRDHDPSGRVAVLECEGTPVRAAANRAAAACCAFDRALGVRLVAGADEAGRGCLAGPLVAAAVLFDYDSLTTRELRSLSALNNSKQHDHAAREELYPRVLACARRVVVVSRSVRSIDSRGLHVMNLQALRDALNSVATPGTLCLIDGFAVPQDCGFEQRAIINGDAAQRGDRRGVDRRQGHPGPLHVPRRRAPSRLAVRDPRIGFSTPEHRAAIARHGVSPLHRLSFQSSAYEQLAL